MRIINRFKWVYSKIGGIKANIMNSCIKNNKGYWIKDWYYDYLLKKEDSFGKRFRLSRVDFECTNIKLEEGQNYIAVEGRYAYDIKAGEERRVPLYYVFIFDSKGVVAKYRIRCSRIYEYRKTAKYLKDFEIDYNKIELVWER